MAAVWSILCISGGHGSCAFADGPVKKPLAVEDLYRFDAPESLTLAPDGARAVYVRRWIDPATRRERFALWLVEGSRDKVKPLEKGEPDGRSPAISPDGKWIAFLSTRPRPNGWKETPKAGPGADAAVNIWLLPITGGEALPLAGPDQPFGRVYHDGFFGRLAFSPDGGQLAFVADDGIDPRSKQEIAADIEIVRPDQGEGLTGYGPAQLWVAHLDKQPQEFAARRIDRLTKDAICYGDPNWSPDGKYLAVHANKTKDREAARYSINQNFDIWLIDVKTRAFRQLTTGPGPEVSPRFAPDGKTLACLSVPRKGSHRDIFNLALVALDGGAAKTRIVFDHHAGNKIGRRPAPVFPLPDDCWEGDRQLYYTADTGLSSAMVRVNLVDGTAHIVHAKAEDSTGPLKSGAQRLGRRLNLTPRGNTFLDDRQVASSEAIVWKNDGLAIEGLLTTPPAAVARPPYKLVLYPHGGPHSRTSLEFDFLVQALAAHGYAVLQPNFRGSAGYGQQFVDADRNDMGGGDMRDCLAGIEHLVKRKLVDPRKQFVFGSSYGGFMTCWLVAQTKQFRAAVAQNAVTDMHMMWALSDIPSWTRWEFAGQPWEVADKMRERSPLTHVAKVQTPTLILHSRDDRRVPLPLGRAFHRALEARNVPTQMVIYPDEGHGIRQPQHREDVLRRMLAWFATHE